MHELILYNADGTSKNITSMISNLSWSSNEDTLGVQLDFDMVNSKGRIYLPLPEGLGIGSLLILRNNGKEIFRGIIVTEEINGEFSRHYTAFDYAFYLNKSKGIYQFNRIQASKAIKQLLNDFNIPIGNITNIPTIINHIYYDKVISDIIKDILQQATNETGQKYRLEMREGKLYIEKQTDLVINATFKLASNLKENNITSAISNPTRRRSIEEMKNSIMIVVNNKDSATLVGEAKDETSIKQYGILQEVQTIDEKDIAQAKNIAQTLLKELNKIFEDNSIECIGNDDVRAGRILNIVEPITGMNGQYRIKSCTHNVNGIHKMSLDLGVV
ncbi:XkdQ/YqbQ family protein [Caloranaerobacter sp. DY30410]|uniref:XkdQ/YqbQ family protein n=1 Tax=Caloranaerobacter sp. DY30410 TaxID=3238305 RepID=UPI003D014C2C